MPEEKLSITIEAPGARQAASDIRDVAAATQQAQGAAGGAGGAAAPGGGPPGGGGGDPRVWEGSGNRQPLRTHLRQLAGDRLAAARRLRAYARAIADRN